MKNKLRKILSTGEIVFFLIVSICLLSLSILVTGSAGSGHPMLSKENIRWSIKALVGLGILYYGAKYVFGKVKDL